MTDPARPDQDFLGIPCQKTVGTAFQYTVREAACAATAVLRSRGKHLLMLILPVRRVFSLHPCQAVLLIHETVEPTAEMGSWIRLCAPSVT